MLKGEIPSGKCVHCNERVVLIQYLKEACWVHFPEDGQGFKDMHDRCFGVVAKPTVECTELQAAWCPIHGDCTCDSEDPLSSNSCPLHSVGATHAEFWDVVPL